MSTGVSQQQKKKKVDKVVSAFIILYYTLTLLISRDGNSRHDVKALGVVHYQWAGAAF